MSANFLLTHIPQLVTVCPSRMTSTNPLGIITNGALVVRDGHLAWIGPQDALDTCTSLWADLPQAAATFPLLLPGLIDSHTHAVFAGDRAEEFDRRLAGDSYQQIAESGGGILKTVEATRQADEHTLRSLTQTRLATMKRFGVTTAEVKVSYGLDLEADLRGLRVLQQLCDPQSPHYQPVQVVPTYMAAHDIPPEYRYPGGTDAYTSLLCEQWLPAVAHSGLARCCDVFCETGYFSPEQTQRILKTAHGLGFLLKVHADEFENTGGAALAAQVGALSADHLLHVSDEGIAALKASNTVATLLPGTPFFLRLPHYAPARKLLDAGVTVAVATDFNPGSCYTENLPLVMQIACLQMGMRPHEVVRGVTLHAAQALGLAADRGSLSAGKRADWLALNTPSVDDWMYHLGVMPACEVCIGGFICYKS